MSSEGCSLDPLLSGNLVQHLQERLLALPPELMVGGVGVGGGGAGGGNGAGPTDLESDDSVYYDVDSPADSTCSNSSSPTDTTPAPLDKRSSPITTPDTTPEFFDPSTELGLHDAAPECNAVEINGTKEESRFRVTTVLGEHRLLNGDAPRDTSAALDLHLDLDPENEPTAHRDTFTPVTTIPVLPEVITTPADYKTGVIVDVSAEMASEPPCPTVPDGDEDFGEMILLDGECYENSTFEEDVGGGGRGDGGGGGGAPGGALEPALKKPELKRCSSLKASKIVEGISTEKKIVRFADALGLDLADVRTFLELEPPKIPRSAFRDLEGVEMSGSPLSGSPLSSGLQTGPPPPPEKTIVPLFRQPIREVDFMERLNRNKVCLECATVTDVNLFTITGTIRVVNLDFHKSVWVRYTKDNWKSFVDLSTKYVENSCDGFSDKFRFVLFAHTLTVGDRLEFALKYQVKNCQYWDNNRSANYAFQCVPEAAQAVRAPPSTVLSAYIPSSASLDSWGSFF